LLYNSPQVKTDEKDLFDFAADFPFAVLFLPGLSWAVW
jgi:hypothetical protein